MSEARPPVPSDCCGWSAICPFSRTPAWPLAVSPRSQPPRQLAWPHAQVGHPPPPLGGRGPASSLAARAYSHKRGRGHAQEAQRGPAEGRIASKKRSRRKFNYKKAEIEFLVRRFLARRASSMVERSIAARQVIGSIPMSSLFLSFFVCQHLGFGHAHPTLPLAKRN